MKTLIIYYSRSGITKRAAMALSVALKCEIEEIKDRKNRSGLIGLLKAGMDSVLGKITKIRDIEKDIAGYDLVIIGGPVWASTVCPAVRTFLLQYMDQLKEVAFFCTEGGSCGRRAFRTMEKIIEKKPAATLILKWADIKSGRYLKKAGEFADNLRKMS